MSWASDMRSTLAEMGQQGGGAVVLHFVTFAHVPGIMHRADAGSADDLRILKALGEALTGIQGAPRKRPMLCACCPRPVRGSGFAIALAMPSGPNPTSALTLAVCDACAPDEDAFQAKATEAFRRIWPDGRPIQVTHPDGGRA